MLRGDRPWRSPAPGCVIVRVRVCPKSSKDTVDGVDPTAEGLAFNVRVRAIPADGEANTAVERLLASVLDIPRGSVTVALGHRSRVQSIEIAGNAALMAARRAALSGSI